MQLPAQANAPSRALPSREQAAITEGRAGSSSCLQGWAPRPRRLPLPLPQNRPLILAPSELHFSNNHSSQITFQ